MERLTELAEGKGKYISKHILAEENGDFSGEAIERLAKFENLLEEMMHQKDELPRELAKLREQGKEKTYSFREILSNKLTIETFLRIMKDFGIE